MPEPPKSSLIVHSVPVAKLGPVIDLCLGNWPEDKISVITDALHFADISDDDRIDETLHIRELDNDGFHGIWKHGQPYQRMIIPMQNSSGRGYAHVFRFLSWTRARQWYLAPQCSCLEKIRRRQLTRLIRYERLVHMLSTPATWILSKMLFSKQPNATFRL